MTENEIKEGLYETFEIIKNASYNKPELSNYFAVELEKHTHKDISIIAKWMPRKGLLFEMVRKRMNLAPKELRQLLVSNSKTLEV